LLSFEVEYLIYIIFKVLLDDLDLGFSGGNLYYRSDFSLLPSYLNFVVVDSARKTKSESGPVGKVTRINGYLISNQKGR
jgi:hypothetical protein